MGLNENKMGEVISLERKLLTVEGRSDIEFLKSVLSDDFEECGASGRVFDKQDVLGRLPAEGNSYSFEAYNMSTTILANDLVMNKFKTKITKNGETKLSHRISLWKLTTIGWRIFYHQGTNLNEQ